MPDKPVFILAIESYVTTLLQLYLETIKYLSNVVANQLIHNEFGGVVPELASRAIQLNIVPVIDVAS